MDQVAVVRHRVLVEGASRREVAESLKISRNTVKRYLAGAPVGMRKASTRKRPALERAESRMEALLADAPRWTGGKQQLAARQLHRMLRAEGIHVGETLVKRYVRERKRRAAEVFVPLVYRPGDLGEVDFFEVLVDVAGKRVKAWMFVLRAMFSGRDFAWLFPRQDQTCFLEGPELGDLPRRARGRIHLDQAAIGEDDQPVVHRPHVVRPGAELDPDFHGGQATAALPREHRVAWSRTTQSNRNVYVYGISVETASPPLMAGVNLNRFTAASAASFRP